jgi:hypothetical protein
MAAKRSYKKRSYKKRGTIRKLKTTLRRKIQRGGVTPEEELIHLVIKMSPGILKLVLGNIEPFVRICVLLATMSSQMGGRSSKSSRLYQTGGALSQNVKDELIQKLSELKQSFTEKQRMDVVACIEKIENKVNTEKTSAENMPVTPTPTVEDELTSQDQAPAPAPDIQSTSMFELTKFKQVIGDKVKQKIESKVTKLQSILNGEEYKCLLTIKDAVLEDFRDKIKNSSIITNVKDGLSAVSGAVSNTVSSKLTGLIGSVGSILKR